jgi:hypothetical protein
LFLWSSMFKIQPLSPSVIFTWDFRRKNIDCARWTRSAFTP